MDSSLADGLPSDAGMSVDVLGGEKGAVGGGEKKKEREREIGRGGHNETP